MTYEIKFNSEPTDETIVRIVDNNKALAHLSSTSLSSLLEPFIAKIISPDTNRNYITGQ